jgi:trigger factor
MSKSVERLSTSEVRIQVSIPWSELEASYSQSLSKVRGSVQVRGFRKGKVPPAMIEKMVGEQLRKEVAVEQVGVRLQEIIREENLMPLRLPLDVEGNLVMSEESEARYDAKVEVLPMIDRIGFEDLELQPRGEIGDDEIRERITLIAARKAPLETALIGREVGEYDQVVLEGKATFKQEGLEPQDVKDFRVDLAPWAEPPQELAEQLRGKKVDDTGEVDLVIPAQGEGAGPRYAHLSYTISEIVTRHVPPIDEDLAKDFDMESLEELRSVVRETLEKESFDEYVTRNGEAILDQLIEKVEFDLPPSYLPPQDDEPSADEDDKVAEQRKQVAALYDRFSRRNLLTMLLAFQNGLKLPEETMKKASVQMRTLIDEQEGTQQEKDRAYDQWHREFEQSLFTRVLSSFLVQEVEKSLGLEPETPPASEQDRETEEKES